MTRQPDEFKPLYAAGDWRWRCHTPAMLDELVKCNPAGAAMRIPVNMLKNTLGRLAQRILEVGDARLVAIASQLTLFANVDPYDKDYDPGAYDKVWQRAQEAEQKEKEELQDAD